MSQQQRRPAAFRLDDPGVVVTPDQRDRASPGPARLTVAPEPALPAVSEPAFPRRGLPWAALFASSAGALAVLGLGLAVTQLIEDLFRRSEELGYVGAALAALASVALLAIIVREGVALWRLSGIEKLHARALETLASDDRIAGRAVARDVLALARGMPRLARARAGLEEHLDDIIDGADFVRLAERELMAPLDREARRFVADAARRVSLVTAVSPRALVDMLFVFASTLMVVRRLAYLYGGRPGTLGMIRLFRHVLAHLALTGSMAAGDSLIQQVLGHGIAARVSIRLGEGVLNGLLTARLGLAAIEVIRPLPFAALARPTLTDVAGNLVRRREGEIQLPREEPPA